MMTKINETYTPATFNVHQLSAYLQMPVPSLYEHARAGRIPSVKVGKRLLFPKIEIDTWLSQQAKQRMTTLAGFFLGLLLMSSLAQAATGTSSWYNIDSTIREKTCTDPAHRICLQANGKPLDDNAFTAASWDYTFGTRLLVCRVPDATCVIVKVADRGPAKSIYRHGRILDLSQSAFQAISPTSQGIVRVTVEPL